MTMMVFEGRGEIVRVPGTLFALICKSLSPIGTGYDFFPMYDRFDDLGVSFDERVAMVTKVGQYFRVPIPDKELSDAMLRREFDRPVDTFFLPTVKAALEAPKSSQRRGAVTGRKLTPYEKIRRAAMNGTGTRLSADECSDLYYRDDAIQTVADADAGGYDGRDGATSEEEDDAG